METPDSVAPRSGDTWQGLRDLIDGRPDHDLSEGERPARALRESFDLFERGVRMMRMNLRREDPTASEDEITRRLQDWLHERSGAPHGDGVERPSPERLARILGSGA